MSLIVLSAFPAIRRCWCFPLLWVCLICPFCVTVLITASLIACGACCAWFFAITRPFFFTGHALFLVGNRFRDFYALCITLAISCLAKSTFILEGRFADAYVSIVSTGLAFLVLWQSWFFRFLSGAFPTSFLAWAAFLSKRVCPVTSWLILATSVTFLFCRLRFLHCWSEECCWCVDQVFFSGLSLRSAICTAGRDLWK